VRLGAEALSLSDGALDDFFLLIDTGPCQRVMRSIVSFDQSLVPPTTIGCVL
jgi:hypothetical protein